MKLTYKILWVEDRIEQPEFKDMVVRLTQYLSEEEFFDASVITVENSEEFENKFSDEYDLIITDYSLGERNGDYIIQYTREVKGILTEIFFYSAQSEIKPMSNLITNSRITFHQVSGANGYRDLYLRIKELIDITIKKFQHIISMRGMVMAETSELDISMEGILKKILTTDSEKNKSAKKVIKDKFIESTNDFIDKFKKMDEIKEFELLLRKIGSEHRWRALKRNCQEDLRAEYSDILENYKKDIIDERNILAHAKYYKEDSNEYLENSNPNGVPYKFDSSRCKEIRKKLNQYKKKFSEFESKIIG